MNGICETNPVEISRVMNDDSFKFGMVSILGRKDTKHFVRSQHSTKKETIQFFGFPQFIKKWSDYERFKDRLLLGRPLR